MVANGRVQSAGTDAKVGPKPARTCNEDLQSQPELAWRLGLAIGVALLAGDDAGKQLQRSGSGEHVLRRLARKLKSLRADAHEIASRAKILAAGGSDLHVAAAAGRFMDVTRTLKHVRKCTARYCASTAAVFEVGDAVQVADGYERVADAAGGPLSPDDVGSVVEASDNAGSIRVEFAGRVWWYERRALMHAEFEEASDPSEGCRRRQCLCVDQTVFSGFTALHLAAKRFAESEHLRILEALIDHGARLCCTREERLSPLQCLLRSPAALAQQRPTNAFLKAVDLLCDDPARLSSALFLEAVKCQGNAILVVDRLLSKLSGAEDALDTGTEEVRMACKLASRMHQDAPAGYLRNAAGMVAARLLAFSNVQEVVQEGTTFCRLNPAEMLEEEVPASIALLAIGLAYNAGRIASRGPFQPFKGVQTGISLDRLLKQGWTVHYKVRACCGVCARVRAVSEHVLVVWSAHVREHCCV